MVVKNKDTNLRLTREFGEKVLVVECLPVHESEVQEMLSNIPSDITDAHAAMAKVRGNIETVHVEKLVLG